MNIVKRKITIVIAFTALMLLVCAFACLHKSIIAFADDQNHDEDSSAQGVVEWSGIFESEYGESISNDIKAKYIDVSGETVEAEIIGLPCENADAGKYLLTAEAEDRDYPLENSTCYYTIKPKAVNVNWDGMFESEYGENISTDIKATYIDVSGKTVEAEIIGLPNANAGAGCYALTAKTENENYVLTDALRIYTVQPKEVQVVWDGTFESEYGESISNDIRATYTNMLRETVEAEIIGLPGTNAAADSYILSAQTNDANYKLIQSTHVYIIQDVSDAEEIEELRKDLEELNKRILSLNNEITYLKSEKSDLEDEIAKLNKSVSELQTTITNLQGNSVSLNAEIDNLKAQLASLKNDKANLDQEIVKLESSILNFKTAIKNLQTDNDSLNEEIDGLEGQVNSLQSTIDSLKGTNNTLDNEISVLNNRIVNMQTEIDVLENSSEGKTAVIIVISLFAVALGAFGLFVLILFKKRSREQISNNEEQIPSNAPVNSMQTEQNGNDNDLACYNEVGKKLKIMIENTNSLKENIKYRLDELNQKNQYEDVIRLLITDMENMQESVINALPDYVPKKDDEFKSEWMDKDVNDDFSSVEYVINTGKKCGKFPVRKAYVKTKDK